MPPINMLIKPASGLCELRCKYCFYKDVSAHREVESYGMMSSETAALVLKRAFEVAEGSCAFAFQGGEPTLRGLAFFREFCALAEQMNEKHLRLDWSIQTNGMALDEEWAAFLHEKGFLVGLSLDGPAELHNAARVDANGKGTYSRVLRAAERLRRHKVEYNILCVVTNQLARSGKKVYEYFKKQGFAYLQFIPCLPPFEGEDAFALTPERYALFLSTLFDAWFLDLQKGAYTSIRHLDNYIHILSGAPPEACSMRGQCSCQFVVEADGSVYPCDFYVTDEWRLGNLADHSLRELFESETSTRFITESFTRDDCIACPYQPLCRGGCRRDFVFDGRWRNRFCESYRQFFAHALPRMQQIAHTQREM